MMRAIGGSSQDESMFLQGRLGAFARVMTIVSSLGVVAHVLAPSNQSLATPWFGLLVLDTALFGGFWLFCRVGSWSAVTLRVLEAFVLISSAFVIGAMGRGLAGGLESGILGPDSPFGPEGRLTLLGFTRAHIGLSLHFGLALGVIARAALVPARAWSTALLTAAVGVPPTVVVLLESSPLDAPAAAGIDIPAEYVGMTIGNAVIWWTITTIVCAAISQVVYGLRREVREARRLGQYTLERKLGEGGMGIVYRARHAMMRRPTAVKLLPLERTGEQNLARFEREVQQTARLTHPNTITIFDYGRTPDGVFYYAMELLDGDTLEAVVEVSGPMTPGRTIHVLAAVASALEEAHGIGLIHRDIKPANILLCTQGGQPDVPKVVDFGLVKEVESDQAQNLTHEQAITGTPLYMSPEALARPHQVDARSDLYALGAVGYYLLTGHHVFDAASVVEICSHHLHTGPTPPSERLGAPAPKDLEAVIMRCLEKDQKKRPQSAAELAELLSQCTDRGAWTPRHARQWWAQHHEQLRGVRQAREASASTRTIAVDLSRKSA